MPVKEQHSRITIVEAARDLFYHQGYGATSYADIAKQTGLGKGNIHYYFNSKDDLLKAVVEQRIASIRALLEEWSLDCSTPYDCLDRFIDMVENSAKDLSRYRCPMGTLNDELGKNNQELQKTARDMFDLFLRWLEARVRALMQSKQAKEHAEHLMVMAQGVSVITHSYRDPELVRKQVKVMHRWLASICTNG
jgi:TetR/AcrR family transcriptional regulator, transcriptional repressor for nem operon